MKEPIKKIFRKYFEEIKNDIDDYFNHCLDFSVPYSSIFENAKMISDDIFVSSKLPVTFNNLQKKINKKIYLAIIESIENLFKQKKYKVHIDNKSCKDNNVFVFNIEKDNDSSIFLFKTKLGMLHFYDIFEDSYSDYIDNEMILDIQKFIDDGYKINVIINDFLCLSDFYEVDVDDKIIDVSLISFLFNFFLITEIDFLFNSIKKLTIGIDEYLSNKKITNQFDLNDIYIRSMSSLNEISKEFFHSELDNIIFDINFDLLIQKNVPEEFAKTFLTSEWLYVNLGFCSFLDNTFILASYFKSVEQLLYYFLKNHVGENILSQYINKKDTSKIMLMQMKNILLSIENNYVFNHFPKFKEEFMDLLDNWILHDRNGFLHKDIITSHDKIWDIRINTHKIILLLFVIFNGEKYIKKFKKIKCSCCGNDYFSLRNKNICRDCFEKEEDIPF